jgi:hypothetical protein
LLFIGPRRSHWHLEYFMEIMKPLTPLLPLAFGLFSPLLFAGNRAFSPGDSGSVTDIAAIHEINTARQNPALYATFLEQSRQNYAGSLRLCTHKGVRAVDQAIRFLRRARPLPPLALSPGLCSAAVDHCREQAGGTVGHPGCGGSDPAS